MCRWTRCIRWSAWATSWRQRAARDLVDGPCGRLGAGRASDSPVLWTCARSRRWTSRARENPCEPLGVDAADLAYVIYTVRLHRPAQGRDGRARATSSRLFAATQALVRLRRRRRLDAVPLVRLRLLGLGDLGRAALRRPPGHRAARGRAARRRTSIALLVPRAASRCSTRRRPRSAQLIAAQQRSSAGPSRCAA